MLPCLLHVVSSLWTDTASQSNAALVCEDGDVSSTATLPDAEFRLNNLKVLANGDSNTDDSTGTSMCVDEILKAVGVCME